MPRPVVILHGYSDNERTFRPLRDYLREHRFDVHPIYLGDYLTLEDEITIEDLAKAFEHALHHNEIPTTSRAFDLIAHSTGALVAREWLTRYYLEPGGRCPLAHFLMLAPANFGSPLAHLGRTMFGRIIKGWRSRFEVGKCVLDALEMASPFTWRLAERDLFGPRSFYEPDQCMTAVLVGSRPYQAGFRQFTDHNGADGTVYVCTANLNAAGLTLRFGRADEPVAVEPWPTSAAPIAFAVFPDRDHSSITDPSIESPLDLGGFITRFLRLGSARTYDRFRDDCDLLTRTTLPPDEPSPPKIYHSYQNVVARVTDDLGMDVTDYFLEFYQPARSERDRFAFDSAMERVHGEALETVHTYRANNAFRSFLFDLTDLRKLVDPDEALCFSLSAAPLSQLIGYAAGAANDISELPVTPGSPDQTRFWRPNQTLLADIRIQRTQADEVLRLKSTG